MTLSFFTDLFRKVQTHSGPVGLRDWTDTQLLKRFDAQHDEGAFEALVQRHGPMVLGVCRQLLRDSHEVEDAFQATFLVLVQKAATIAQPHLLANWLYGVAYRVAARARAKGIRRYQRERQGVEMTAVQPTDQDSLKQVWPVLHEEVNRLPDRYRSAVVLCYLEGKTRQEAVRQLGWTEGAVKGNLERARELLRGRLIQRGVTVSSGLLATALTPATVSAAIPAPLVNGTIHSALLIAARQEVAIGSVGFGSLRIGMGICLAVGLLGAGLCCLVRPDDIEGGRTRSDLAMMSQAIAAWQVRFGMQGPFPSRLMLCEQYNEYDQSRLATDSIAFLQRTWPRITTTNADGETTWSVPGGWIDWNGSKSRDGPWILQGQECLVFFLGGIPTGQGTDTPRCTGFSTSPTNPAAHISPGVGSVIPPVFAFDGSRLTRGQSGSFLQYRDGYEKAPYAYFSSYKTTNGYNRYLAGYGDSDCAALGVWPYAVGPGRYLSPDAFQIISAGRDGVFGSGSTNPARGPFFSLNAPMYQPGQSGYDDLGSFHNRPFGEPMD